MKQLVKRVQKGFTLIEILVVIGIIAVLAGIVLIAVNPARQFALARNAQRQSDLNAIINAVGQDIAENKGIFTCSTTSPINTLPPLAPPKNIANVNGAFVVALDCLVPKYLAALPHDPNGGTDADTKYTIGQDTIPNGSRITVTALGEADAGTLSIVR